jgi:hypothetical protein
MKRFQQAVLIGSTLTACWLGMQAIHEAGHILGAWISGGEVERVVLHPLTISRTDLARNPNPLFVVWSGPIFGSILPLALWAAATAIQLRESFVLRFFAGFCLIANGAYIAVGSIDRIGDCGEILRNGSPIWLLWAFGAVAVPAGLWLWHRQGKHFGLGAAGGEVDRCAAYSALIAALLFALLGFLVGGK